MVRVKKRYLVLQFDLVTDLSRRKSGCKSGVIINSRLEISDALLAKAVRDLVQEFHGDHGAAMATSGNISL